MPQVAGIDSCRGWTVGWLGLVILLLRLIGAGEEGRE